MKTPWEALDSTEHLTNEPAPRRYARPLRQADLDLYCALVGHRPAVALAGAALAGDADLTGRLMAVWGSWRGWRGIVERVREGSAAVAVRLDPAGRAGEWLADVRAEVERRWAEAKERLVR